LHPLATKQQAKDRKWWGRQLERVPTLRAAGGGMFWGAEYKFVANELVTGASNVAARR